MNNYMFPIPPFNNNNYYYTEEIRKLYEIIKQLDKRITKIENDSNKQENKYMHKDENYHMI